MQRSVVVTGAESIHTFSKTTVPFGPDEPSSERLATIRDTVSQCWPSSTHVALICFSFVSVVGSQPSA